MVSGTQRLDTPTKRYPMTDTIVLSIPSSRRLRSVATLVVGGMGSRFQLPYEKIDDLQLAVLSVLPAATDSEVTLELVASDESLSVDVGPLASGSAADAGLARVLERLVDVVEPATRDGREWLTLRLRRAVD
jgi:hypothetical protein